MRQWTFALLTLVALGGCGEVTTLKAAPEPELEEGWTVYESNKAPVSIAAPDGWGPTGGTAKAVPSRVSPVGDPMASNEDIMQQMQDLGSFGEEDKDIVLYIADKGTRPLPGEVRTGYSIRRFVKSGGYSLDAAVADTKGAVTNEGTPKMIDLPVGKAAEFRYNYKTPGGDEVYKVIYVLVNNEDVYRVTFSQTGSGEPINGIATQAIQTFRVSNPAAKTENS